MEAATATDSGTDRLRERSIGLPQVLFQSITHMAPGAAIAFSILFSIQFAGPALPLSVLLALIGCLLVAASIGQLAKEIPSAIANANAGVNASTRVLYSMGRNGLLPRAFGRTHPVHKTPHVAIVAQTIFGVLLALVMAWKWTPLVAVSIIAVAVTIVVICVYVTVCVACVVYYRRERPGLFNPWLHVVFPFAGALVFLAPLFYQHRPLPAYPVRYASGIAIAWLLIGLVVTAWMTRNRREALDNADRVFVGESPHGIAGPHPETGPAPAAG